jgi:hypothetical protein
MKVCTRRAAYRRSAGAARSLALDRAYRASPFGEQHELRSRVAKTLVRCAKSGKTTVGHFD